MANALMTGNNASDAPTSAVSFDQFYNDYGRNRYGSGWIDVPGDHWLADVANWFTGDKSRAKSAYDAYLINLDNENKFKAANSANAWSEKMANTQYQRAVADLKAAGLNPWLASQSGVSGSDVPSSAKAEYGSSRKSESKSSNNGVRNIALLLMAVAKLLA